MYVGRAGAGRRSEGGSDRCHGCISTLYSFEIGCSDLEIAGGVVFPKLILFLTANKTMGLFC